jgi:predicted metal-dependent hydrolase
MKAPFYRAGVLSRWQPSPSLPETLALKTGNVPVLFLRKPSARRYILRVKDDGVLRVTIPRGGSRGDAQEFALRNADWIQKQFEKAQSRAQLPEAWQHGTEILFRGNWIQLEVRDDLITFADQSLPLPLSEEDIRRCVIGHLQALAVRELRQRTIELANSHELVIHRVTIRSQRSRWGSCSIKAHISLNWRLIQTPPYVSDYIILHELMHLKEMNHSPRFWKCVAEVCPDYQRAETWLKTCGRNMLQ